MTSLLPNLLVPPTVLSVAGLTGYMQTLLEQDSELMQVWLTGEVSSASQHRSGLFFTLQDPDANASIRCIAWSNQLDTLTILPVQGEQVILLGRIRLYPQRGEYQLVVWQCLPAGEGLRALRYRQLHDRLAAEGLFDPDRKRSLPTHPQTIAVVTSTKAAAWGDIQRTLKSRYPGLKVLLSSAVVQGDQAAESIAAAIARVSRDGRAEVLLLSRGGGATEDMVCFNDERVVRAIAEAPIPVITGIGHQRDECLADLVADVCAHTPTAAAQQIVPNLADLQLEHQERVAALVFSLEACLSVAQDQLDQQCLRLQRLPLDRQLSQELRAIAHLKQHLLQVASQQIQQRSLHQDLLTQKLQSLNPQSVLERGYAVARQANGQIVRAAAQLEPAEELTLQLATGQVRVQVIDVVNA
ncbi:MAG: exodeoxyribonuclease VII large subunit [Aphanocapsa sp. GSE-SYN-MK-11-07L]|jgi:exodeoxyribonuclease VII large subunit|nr:exodeoxyribonuclease VII large subunit [Aphanocapsa sp. GSE-SYN-MK-11-07L]